MNLKEVSKKFIIAFIGLTICGLGTYLMIQAAIGVTPWETLQLGISSTLRIPYGIACMIISIVVLVFDIVMGEKIGIGTVLDAFYTGMAVTAFQYIDPVPEAASLAYAIPLLIVGMFVLAFGQYVYINAGLCCGPRDGFLVAIGRLLSRFPIGAVNFIILTVVFILGAILGGPVGIGTIIGTLGFGPVQQLVFNAFHFDPRSVEQKGIMIRRAESKSKS